MKTDYSKCVGYNLLKAFILKHDIRRIKLGQYSALGLRNQIPHQTRKRLFYYERAALQNAFYVEALHDESYMEELSQQFPDGYFGFPMGKNLGNAPTGNITPC